MEIKGISASLPQRIVDNEEILELIKYYSGTTPRNILCELLEQVKHVLNKAGSKTRHWRLNHEKPLHLIEEAFMRAVIQADISYKDIDVLIYSSIHRGVAEPSTASVVCKKLKIKPQFAFDTLDACMGWATAVDIARKYLDNGEYQAICIITAEFSSDDKGAIFPKCYQVSSAEDLNRKLAAYTMGEGATATILINSSHDWKMIREEFPEFAPYCSVPGPSHKLFSEDEDNYARNGEGVFVADMRCLAMQGYRNGLQIMKRFVSTYGQPDIIIPHSISEILPLKVKEKLGLNGRVLSTFSKYGNLATSSIPTTLTTYINSKQIGNNDNAVGWIGSAGMKFCVFSLPISSSLLS